MTRKILHPEDLLYQESPDERDARRRNDRDRQRQSRAVSKKIEAISEMLDILTTRVVAIERLLEEELAGEPDSRVRKI